MSRIRFELDRSLYGRVRASEPVSADQTQAVSQNALVEAIKNRLGVEPKVSRQGWFGPKRFGFSIKGHFIEITHQKNGEALIDLSLIDDDLREHLIESLRQGR